MDRWKSGNVKDRGDGDMQAHMDSGKLKSLLLSVLSAPDCIRCEKKKKKELSTTACSTAFRCFFRSEPLGSLLMRGVCV